jgi:iron complex outermembrane receptor protein
MHHFRYSFLILILLSTVVFAQTGTIIGTVENSEGQPIPHANVVLAGTNKGAATDSTGRYVISNIESGIYLLRVSSIGFKEQQREVVVKSGETLPVHFVLRQTAHQLPEVVVFSDAETYTVTRPSLSLRINGSLLDVPQNIRIVPKAVLRDQQIFDMLEGVQRNVSGVHRAEHWDVYASMHMRGSEITPFRNGMNVRLSPWSPLTEDMSMVDRIEFVKGPAGFMLANGEPGGFYNVVTKKPTGLEKREATFSVGSYGNHRATLDVEGKFSEDGKLLYRLNMMGQLRGTHRDHEFANRYSIASVLKYLIGDETSILLEYNEQFVQMSAIGSNYAFSKKGFGDLPVHFTTTEPNLSPSSLRDKAIFALFQHSLNSNWRFTTQLAYLHFTQEGQGLWPWGFRGDSFLQRGLFVWDALGTSKNGQVFVNGTFQTAGLEHNILAGVDANHKEYYGAWDQGAALGDTTFNIYSPEYGKVNGNQLPKWDRTKDVREVGRQYQNNYSGFYLQDEIGLFDALRVTVGGRYTTNTDGNPYTGRATVDKFTPRAGVSYSLTENSSAYALYDEIFRPNLGTDWRGNNFPPITGENVEFGVKNEWFDGRWNSSLSFYRVIKNNLLTTDTEHPDTATGRFIYSRATGEQQFKGIEIDINGRIMENLHLILNYAYTDARITKDSNPQLVGKQVHSTAKHIHNVWFKYAITVGALDGMKLSAGYQYLGGRSATWYYSPDQPRVPDYFRVDAGIGYQVQSFTVDLLVNNLLNRYLYIGGAFYPFGNYYWWQAEPLRNYRLTVAYRF